MPRGRFQQQQWEARQAAILTALETLSAQCGFANVTMDDLAHEVGISKATLYQHFDSKDTMLVDLMATRAQHFIDAVTSTAGQPPLDRLRCAMRHLLGEHITPLRGMIQLGREEVLPVFHQNEALLAQHVRTLDLLADVIVEGQAQGVIAADLAPRTIVGAMWALSNVSIRTPMSHDPAPPLDVEQLIILFERGIRPPVEGSDPDHD